jgi:hypothetical protein
MKPSNSALPMAKASSLENRILEQIRTSGQAWILSLKVHALDPRGINMVI